MSITRRSVVTLLGLGLLASGLGVFASVPRAQGRRAAPRRLARAAEWGVWKYRAGHVTSLEELAAELPSFVHRGRPGAEARPPRPPRVQVPRIQVRKPVLYLYSGEPCRPQRVRVSVSMPVGGQSLYYPAASTSRSGLTFAGFLYPTRSRRGCGSAPRPMARVDRTHFWHDLRQVPASVFEASGESERFIFYDGLTELRTPYIFYGPDVHGSVGRRQGRPAQAGEDDVVFVVHAGIYRRVVLPADVGAPPFPIASGDERPKRRLERDLREQLIARGLTRPEAQSLLDTWRPDLVDADGDRRIYFVDRADYDQMLPITISPRPRELVRVGVVIEES